MGPLVLLFFNFLHHNDSDNPHLLESETRHSFEYQISLFKNNKPNKKHVFLPKNTVLLQIKKQDQH